jgi:AcrR family transcriptional regulator
MTETNNGATFDRLLQVAIEVFAEYGFRDATVREICNRANVNVASVNYYFRSKDVLYSHALSFAFQEANRLYPHDAALDASLPAEQRLGLFIDNFFHKLLDDSHLGCHGRLITREIAEPTKAFDDIITTMITPHFELLTDIVRLLIGKHASDELVSRCVSSILGQCLMFKHSRSIIDRLYPQLIADDTAINACVEHITQFSLAALQSISRE